MESLSQELSDSLPREDDEPEPSQPIPDGDLENSEVENSESAREGNDSSRKILKN